MSVNLTAKKSDALSLLTTYCGQALDLITKLESLNSYYSDNQFLTGGANAITDADCSAGPGIAHLSAALVNQMINALQSADTALSSLKPLLRQVAPTVTQSR